MKVNARQPPASLRHEHDTRGQGRSSEVVPDRPAVRGVVDVVNASSAVSRSPSLQISYYSSLGRPCPRCNGLARRVKRRFIDVCVSIFMPVHRYRCREVDCSWEGNLHATLPPRPNPSAGEPASRGTAAVENPWGTRSTATAIGQAHRNPSGEEHGGVGYHERVEDFSVATRDRHREIVSLLEELEAVDGYNRCADAGKAPEHQASLEHNRDEANEHASMVLEWIRRSNPSLSKQLRENLFAVRPMAHK